MNEEGASVCRRSAVSYSWVSFKRLMACDSNSSATLGSGWTRASLTSACACARICTQNSVCMVPYHWPSITMIMANWFPFHVAGLRSAKRSRGSVALGARRVTIALTSIFLEYQPGDASNRGRERHSYPQVWQAQAAMSSIVGLAARLVVRSPKRWGEPAARPLSWGAMVVMDEAPQEGLRKLVLSDAIDRQARSSDS